MMQVLQWQASDSLDPTSSASLLPLLPYKRFSVHRHSRRFEAKRRDLELAFEPVNVLDILKGKYSPMLCGSSPWFHLWKQVLKYPWAQSWSGILIRYCHQHISLWEGSLGSLVRCCLPSYRSFVWHTMWPSAPVNRIVPINGLLLTAKAVTAAPPA